MYFIETVNSYTFISNLSVYLNNQCTTLLVGMCKFSSSVLHVTFSCQYTRMFESINKPVVALLKLNVVATILCVLQLFTLIAGMVIFIKYYFMHSFNLM